MVAKIKQDQCHGIYSIRPTQIFCCIKENEWIDKVNSGTFTCYSNLYLKKIPIVILKQYILSNSYL